jgi:hypothetical protein
MDPNCSVSFVTFDAPPDPGQLNEQAFPLMQEYCHSNATSDAPRGGRPSACYPERLAIVPKRRLQGARSLKPEVENS